jgi:serine/threonine-protein kinase
MEVAGYRLEATLGTGGQGTVFRATREGRTYAVKFIFLPRAAHWAWRELDVMVKLWRAGGLPLEGHGLWPAHQPLFLFLVMPYVRGLPLDVWTRVHNPNALQVAQLMRQCARQLSVVHAAGVIHRDVKGANLLVYGEERLVLVDFGVATYEGAPSVTGPFPPGTWPYLSPRVWRAWRGEEDSHACPGDDVWAFGVELYLQLTGRLPFEGSEGALVQAILHAEPPVPHEYNPRVPKALGEVCWRMLRKQPGERYADALAVDAAIEEAMKQADESWRMALCEAWGPHNATTVRERDMWGMGTDLMALYERLAAYARQPVRGKPLPLDEVSTLPCSEQPPGFEALDIPPVCEEASGNAPRSRRLLQAAGAVLVLGLSLWLAMCPPPNASVHTTPPEGTPRATLPQEFFPIAQKWEGKEVAPPWKQPEGAGGAAPEAAATPAPVARATRSQETRVKTPTKAPTPPPQPKQPGSPAGKVGTLMLGCALATGCPSPTTTSQVRPKPPLPPPAECPEGAAQTMEELGLLYPGSDGGAIIPNAPKFSTVRSGPVTMRLTGTDYWGKLPRRTLFTGELIVSERVHGRFTQAHTPDGHTYVVCLELTDGPRFGLERWEGSGEHTARIISGGWVEPVERFGEPWRYEDREKR